MRKRSILAAILLLSLGLVGCNQAASVGDVKLVSAEEQHTPFQNFIFSLKDGLAVDSERRDPKDIVNQLEAVLISDDAHIVISGKTTGQQYYTLYDAQYKEIYARQDIFVPPDESGRYVLCVEVTWGTEKEYTGYQYFFLMEK